MTFDLLPRAAGAPWSEAIAKATEYELAVAGTTHGPPDIFRLDRGEAPAA